MKMLVHPFLVWLMVSEVFSLAPLQIAVAVVLAALLVAHYAEVR
jgi:hypothetical protein